MIDKSTQLHTLRYKLHTWVTIYEGSWTKKFLLFLIFMHSNYYTIDLNLNFLLLHWQRSFSVLLLTNKAFRNIHMLFKQFVNPNSCQSVQITIFSLKNCQLWTAQNILYPHNMCLMMSNWWLKFNTIYKNMIHY